MKMREILLFTTVIAAVSLSSSGHRAQDEQRHSSSVSPRVVHIMGLKSYKCLLFKPVADVAELHECVRDDSGVNQQWVLLDDGTIRANDYRAMCLTSMARADPYRLVVVEKCEPDKAAQQRWEMKEEDGTIYHPGDPSLVMDVIEFAIPPVHQQVAILFTRNGYATQQWTFVE